VRSAHAQGGRLSNCLMSLTLIHLTTRPEDFTGFWTDLRVDGKLAPQLLTTVLITLLYVPVQKIMPGSHKVYRPGLCLKVIA
jgi:hypothetical protein